MARFLYTHANPYPHAAKLSKLGDRTLITASPLAARALGGSHQPLMTFAIKQLEQAKWALASPLKAQTLFRQTLQATLQPADELGITKAWLPSVRSLLQSHPNLDAVAEPCSERTRQLLHVAQQFQHHLHQQRLIDISEVYWQALQFISEPQTVLIYGYGQPRRDELAWIDAIAADHSAVCIPAPDAPLFTDVRASVDWLAQQGWEIVPDANNSESTEIGDRLSRVFVGHCPANEPLPGVNTHSYPTVDAELRGTLAQVKTLLNSGTPARAIAIIARDEVAYGPQLIDMAWEYGVPLRALYDTPLQSTRLGAWLNLLMEVIDTGWPFEATAKLLSHPLCSNPDQAFWSTVRVRHPVGFRQWQAIAQQQLELDLSPLATIKRKSTPETWVNRWYEIFQAFELRRRCARWARESIAFNTLYEGMVELSKSDEGAIAWPEFRQTFRDLLQLLTVPAQPGRGGVELHKPTAVVGAQYPHLFVIGMAEGSLPAPIGNDPVLDFFERQQLQAQGLVLPSAAELARREALSFAALLQTATGTVTFSYARLANRQEQLSSPYLKQLGLSSAPPPVPAIASPEEWRRAILRHDAQSDDAVLRAARHAFTVEQHRESPAARDEYDGIIGIPFDYSDWTFSVSQLTRLGQCPFKWFADKALKLGPPAEVDEELSPSQIGQLYHKVLDLLLAEKQKNPALDITDAKLLEAQFAIAEQDIIPADLSSWSLRRGEHLRCLALAIAAPSFLPEEAEPLQLEATFKGEWQGLKVGGRVDRIDRTENGLVLIDYKTGKQRPVGINDRNGKACIDLQLPLYQEAAGPDLFPDAPVADAYYYSIRGRKALYISSKVPQHELPDAIDRCKTYLDTGHYPVQPDKDQKACNYCDFDALCRQGSRLSRKETTNGTD